MFRWLRKVRFRLLSDGNLRKYLAYVLGEVLLIVVGILIALAINNNMAYWQF